LNINSSMLFPGRIPATLLYDRLDSLILAEGRQPDKLL
jgi:hypothetical protein